MYYNPSVEKWAYSMKEKLFAKKGSETPAPTLVHYRPSTTRRFDDETVEHSNGIVTISKKEDQKTTNEATNVNIEVDQASSSNDSVDGKSKSYPWIRPRDSGILSQLYWALYLPINILLYCTIPSMKKLYPICFLMCMAWIGAITYVVAWMITLIGYTFGIPDSVMGLSFLAIGTSVPEVFSSLIVSRQGKGSMAVSNSIGSNTFDILVCLGLPWTIKAVMNSIAGNGGFVSVNSEGLAYTVISLLASLILLYVILVWGKFVMTKLIGTICLVVYAIFLAISILFELNVFFLVNLPTCKADI